MDKPKVRIAGPGIAGYIVFLSLDDLQEDRIVSFVMAHPALDLLLDKNGLALKYASPMTAEDLHYLSRQRIKECGQPFTLVRPTIS